MRRLFGGVATLLIACGVLAAPVSDPAEGAAHGVQGGEPIRPVPRSPPADSPSATQIVALGAALFADTRLSARGTVACSSCHDLATNGATGRRTDLRSDGTQTARNTQTVFNASLNFRLGWDGDARTLAAQVDTSVRESMGQTMQGATDALAADPAFAARFRAAFGRGPDPAGVMEALVAFQQTLVTPDSPFDRWLAGDAAALTNRARDGYTLFKALGCVSCHQGVNVGGNLFQRSGVYEILGDPARPVLRVPSLRNVATTAPYFHDGSAATLPEAVRMMAGAQLDKRLSDEQTGQVVAFLESLTGSYAGRPVRTSDDPR